MLTLVEYVLLVPDSIERPPARPAGLLASYSGTSPHIEPNHTQALAGLLTAAWQYPCQCLSPWALALAACLGIQLLRVIFMTCRRRDQLSAHQQHQPQPATLCALRTGV